MPAGTLERCLPAAAGRGRSVGAVDSLFLRGSGCRLGFRNRGIRFGQFLPLRRVAGFHDCRLLQVRRLGVAPSIFCSIFVLTRPIRVAGRIIFGTSSIASFTLVTCFGLRRRPFVNISFWLVVGARRRVNRPGSRLYCPRSMVKF